MTHRSLLLPILAAAVTTVAASAPALAVHKNWVIRNAGAQCAFTVPGNNTDNHTSGTFNGASYARFASCPVSLSGRWGSSSNPNFSPPLSAAAMAANVYVVNSVAGQEFYCTARARMGSGSQLGSLYYSRTAIRTAGGDGLISVAYGSDWAGTMEANQSSTLRSLDLECRIPPSYSGVYAYKVRICQTNSSCFTTGQADGEALITYDGASSGSDYVQTSGIECVTDHNTSNRATRSENGMKNTSTTNWVGVYCPISQPADDSYDGWRRVSSVRVYYSGGSGAPTCQLTWRDRYPSFTGVTVESWSKAFVADQFNTSTLIQSESSLLTRWDVSTVVWCDVRPAQPIKGIPAMMRVAYVIDAS